MERSTKSCWRRTSSIRRDASAIEASLARGSSPADVRYALTNALGLTLAEQPSQFRPRHRALLAEPGGNDIVGAIIVADHAWFLSHIKGVLGVDEAEAPNRLYYGLRVLRLAEAAVLGNEIEVRRTLLGGKYTTARREMIGSEMSDLSGRDGSVRWSPVSIVP